MKIDIAEEVFQKDMTELLAVTKIGNDAIGKAAGATLAKAIWGYLSAYEVSASAVNTGGFEER